MPAKHIYLIGPMPPPTTGHSVAFRMLCEAAQDRNVPHRVIDIGRGAATRRDSGFSLVRAMMLVAPVL